MILLNMKKLIRLWGLLVCAMMMGTALSSCLHGEMYGQYAAEEESGSGGSGDSSGGGGSGSGGSSETENSDLLYTTTGNSVRMTFQIIDESKKQCQLGTGEGAAIATSSTGALAIPSTVKGYTVVKIGDYAFEDCSQLTSVTIPATITTIGKEAFSNCQAFTSIEFPESITYIGSNCFQYCYGLTSVITNIKVPFVIPVNTFANYNATLTVPTGTKDSYENITGWKQFSKIVEPGNSSNPDPVDVVIEGDGKGSGTWKFGDYTFTTDHAYWGYNTKEGYMVMYFSNFNLLGAVDINKESGTPNTVNLPEHATMISLRYWSENSTLQAGSYKPLEVVIQDFDYTKNTATFFAGEENSPTITILKEGDTYTLTTSTLKLSGGTVFDNSKKYVDPEIPDSYIVKLDATLGYSGPLTQIPENYMKWMFYDE